jgi:hypothetical protein
MLHCKIISGTDNYLGPDHFKDITLNYFMRSSKAYLLYLDHFVRSNSVVYLGVFMKNLLNEGLITTTMGQSSLSFLDKGNIKKVLLSLGRMLFLEKSGLFEKASFNKVADEKLGTIVFKNNRLIDYESSRIKVDLSLANNEIANVTNDNLKKETEMLRVNNNRVGLNKLKHVGGMKNIHHLKEAQNVIVILLESPHDKEFFLDKSAAGPAMDHGANRTGGRINLNLLTHLDSMFSDSRNGFDAEDGTYTLVFMNAIEYQTSLGLKTGLFRDRLWLNSWRHGFANSFAKRLESYDPVAIINLCTDGSHVIGDKKGETKITSSFLEEESYDINDDGSPKGFDPIYKKSSAYPLKGFVQSEIDGVFGVDSDIFQLWGPHPSSKHFENLKNFKTRGDNGVFSDSVYST